MAVTRPKYIILVGDGMGDLPLPELNNKTPLEAAHTPAMDFIARHGELALLRTIPPGLPPGSDVANLSLLGYLPEKYYTGRAPLEAASMGVVLGSGDLAMRCNLVTLDRDTAGALIMKDYSAGHISTEEARLLVVDLSRLIDREGLSLYPGISYRHLLVHHGDLPGLVTVPPHDHTGKNVAEFWQQYMAFPQIKGFLEAAGELLARHEVNRNRVLHGKDPANALWLWGEGRSPAMPTLKERYGIEGALISAVDLLRGIGVCAGMEIIRVPGATGYLDTNYSGKAAVALAALDRNDLVFVHVEAPDEVSHQGLIREKIQAIEDFDQKIVQPILEGLKKGGRVFRMAVLMDHFTPVSTKTHASYPVPVAIYDSRIFRPASGLFFSENDAKRCGRFLVDGQVFLETLLEDI